ncbi:family 43 glycosylhydrolase [Streptosporangium algeriense]|uniref:Family 43 glycosylhydrolase n=1 Tax=Streptosporangium algeriense TaxID=1682748 RepID=A0ABW3DP03_9ACTN
MSLRAAAKAAVALCVAVLLPLQAAGPVGATPVTITNGTRFADTAGNPVQAHNGSMTKVGRYFYWFGENPYADGRFRSVSVYRSADLRAWEFRRNVLTQAQIGGVKYLKGPRIIYNSRTRKFALFMQQGNGAVMVATSATVDGSYTKQRSFTPLGEMSFGMTVFQDNDGNRTSYLISRTGAERKNLTVYRLTPDYLKVAAREHVLSAVGQEAPVAFKRNGVYFLVSADSDDGRPGQAGYATATSLRGPWSGLSDLGDATTYDSRPSHVLPVQGSGTTSYLYMGDRPAGGGPDEGEYVWLPLGFPTNRSLSMSWHKRISVDTETGKIFPGRE